jgi:hypothetical protein
MGDKHDTLRGVALQDEPQRLPHPCGHVLEGFAAGKPDPLWCGEPLSAPRREASLRADLATL